VTTYDRSELIDRSVDNLKHTLIEELIIVSLVIMIFLWHFPSAFIPIITIPVTVILAFIPMQWMGMTANIMSLGGIAVAIGAMVDALSWWSSRRTRSSNTGKRKAVPATITRS
jgi:Cu(I)/Ag(I) efflux system membrane protein CusA/SilA